MSVESHILTEELGDKGHWLRKFRKAKNLNTLQLMVSNAIDKHHKTPAIAAAIYLAECQRERELEQVMRDFLQQRFNVLLCST
uniref:hypothetical protein n=1 Tax=Aeromonas taiwanensis TaxID=633417 RepID=UPI00248D6931